MNLHIKEILLTLTLTTLIFCYSAFGEEPPEESSSPAQEVKSSITQEDDDPRHVEESETLPPEEGEEIKSLGLPRVWKPYAGALFNWDRRGKDDYGGEVMVIVSGLDAGIAYLDFFWLMGLTNWVDDLEELRELLPEESKFGRWLGRLIRYAL